LPFVVVRADFDIELESFEPLPAFGVEGAVVIESLGWVLEPAEVPDGEAEGEPVGEPEGEPLEDPVDWAIANKLKPPKAAPRHQ
jgi:hypothetical protein